MKLNIRLLAALLALGSAPAPALAELPPGSVAPAFSTRASLGGKTFGFDLKSALAKGPVVLYFYPAAFTTGCTLEAHDFASHIDDYRRLGATVIGVSGDNIATLTKFSVSECRSKFAVASDADHAISKAYDATLGLGPVQYSNRTSYVIAPDGKIVFAYTSLDPSRHVANTLEALRKLPGQRPGR
ncbi:MAG: peroxiredoxin [Vulcanimicrobiaceae bacterium]